MIAFQRFFQYELCSYPPALFEDWYAPRLANKVQLADALWNMMPSGMSLPQGDINYVLDGGALLHRIAWEPRYYIWRDMSAIHHICEKTRWWANCRIWRISQWSKHEGHNTTTQSRTSCWRTYPGLRVSVIWRVLSNKENKQKFITLLDGHLRQHGCRTQHARADADLLIVQTAIATAENTDKPIVVVADDHRHSCSSLLPFKDVYVKLVSSSWTSIWN